MILFLVGPDQIISMVVVVSILLNSVVRQLIIRLQKESQILVMIFITSVIYELILPMELNDSPRSKPLNSLIKVLIFHCFSRRIYSYLRF